MENSPYKPRLGYKKLEAWKQAVHLAHEIQKITNFFKGDAWEIRSQMNRSVESVSSNIAEAEGRFTNRDALRLYYIARGSLWELNSQIAVCVARGLIDIENGNRLGDSADSVGRLLGGIIRMRRIKELKIEQMQKIKRRPNSQSNELES